MVKEYIIVQEHIVKLTDEQLAILEENGVTIEDLWKWQDGLLAGHDEREKQKEYILNELIDRRWWSEAFEKWMDKKDVERE